jgi:hypothetical protein
MDFEKEIIELVKDRIQKEMFRAQDLRTKMLEEHEIQTQEYHKLLVNHIKQGQTITNMTDFEIVSKYVEQIPITTLRNDLLVEEARKQEIIRNSSIVTLSGSFRSRVDDDMSTRTVKGTRSNIERNLDKTFENCKTIIISEKYNGTEVSISLKRKENITSWKKGAWVDDNGISYKNPNDCWKKLISNHFGEIGLKKFNGQNVWGKNGRLITITNRGNIFDINQNPMRVIMDLEKCKGLYLGREFFSYKEEDFIQMV